VSTCQIYFKRRQEVHPNLPRALFSITPSALWLKRATTASKKKACSVRLFKRI